MNNDFWLERWEKNETGFHQEEINPHLEAYWKDMEIDAGCEVFVPLCGKSLDMLWLKSRGHEVLGVELSPLAVGDFFAGNGINPRRERQGKFDVFHAEGIRILCGDFFDLSKADLAGCGAVYDRASLIALPPSMRRAYAAHLVDILPSPAEIFLVTLDYSASEMQGPPFPVSREEVELLYGENFEVMHLADADALTPRFRQRGLSALKERVFRLKPSGPRD